MLESDTIQTRAGLEPDMIETRAVLELCYRARTAVTVVHLVVEVIVDTPQVEAGVERVLLEEAGQLLAVVVEGPGQAALTQGTRQIWYNLTTSYH